MKVLFLDFDGVLNSKQYILMKKGTKVPEDKFEDMKFCVDPHNMWVLKYILDNVPKLKVVISSSWRNFFDLELFPQVFEFYGLDGTRVIGKTPKKFSSERCHEIRMWLEDARERGITVEDFVALDDHPIFDVREDQFVNQHLTDSWNGLTLADAFVIIKRFNPNFQEPIIAI